MTDTKKGIKEILRRTMTATWTQTMFGDGRPHIFNDGPYKGMEVDKAIDAELQNVVGKMLTGAIR